MASDSSATHNLRREGVKILGFNNNPVIVGHCKVNFYGFKVHYAFKWSYSTNKAMVNTWHLFYGSPHLSRG